MAMFCQFTVSFHCLKLAKKAGRETQQNFTNIRVKCTVHPVVRKSVSC